MAKVPKRVIRGAQLRANETLQWYNKPGQVWASTMADLRLIYNQAKAGAKEYGFNN